MKLLIVTQKVDINDDVLGFMHGWIAEFAKHCEKLTVICLQKGEYDLPRNVKVLSLGKEKYLREEVWLRGGAKRRKKPNLKEQILFRIKYIFNFYKYIWQERKNYDSVFVHMNKEYVILGGVFWRLWRKKVGLWYAHGHVPLGLKIAEKLINIVFTSTKSGCRIKSDKIRVIGQGIDINQLSITNYELSIDNKIKIITVGRISPVKDYETLIKAAEILYKEYKIINLRVDIVGGAGLPEQEKYLDDLKKMALDKKLDGIIKFTGAVPNKEIVDYLRRADLFVNTSRTGSLDKAIAEAMACGLLTLTCNEALEGVFGCYKSMLMYPKGDYKELAKKIAAILKLSQEEKQRIGKDLRNIIVNKHSLDNFVAMILKNYY